MTQLDLAALLPSRAETMFPDAGPEPVEVEQCDDLPVPAGGLTHTLFCLTDLVCVVTVAGPLWQPLYSSVLTGIVIMGLVAILISLRAHTGHTPSVLFSGMVVVADGSDHASGLRRQLVYTTLVILLYVAAVGPLVASFLNRDGRDLVNRVAETVVFDLRPERPCPGSGDGNEGTEKPLLRGQESSSFPVPGTPVLPSSPAPTTSPLTPHRAASQKPAPAVPPGNIQTDPLTPCEAVPSSPTPPRPSSAPAAGLTGLPGMVRAWLVVNSGQRKKVNSALVARREPTGTNGEHRLIIPGPTNPISRTHLRLSPAGGGVWVEGVASMSRTAVRNAASAVAHLVRGRRTLFPPRTAVITGERAMMVMSGLPR